MNKKNFLALFFMAPFVITQLVIAPFAAGLLVLRGLLLDNPKNKAALKQAEEALRASEEKLRLIFDSIPDNVSVIDMNGKILEANDAAVRLFGGTSIDQFIGRNGFDFIASSSKEKALAEFPKIFNKKVGGPDEYRIRRIDGSEFDGEVFASLLKDKDGKPQGIITVIRDITELKQAEESLRASEEKLRLIFASIPDNVSVIDMNGKILEGNAAGVRMFGGTSFDQFFGRDGFDFIASGSKEKALVEFPKVFSKEVGGPDEYRIRRIDGSEFDGEVIASLLKDKDDKPQGIITVIRDITERKRAEQALRESEEMSRSMLDNAAMGVYLLQDKKFLYVNPTFEKIIGYASEELVGRDAINYVHPNDRSTVRIKAAENLKGISNLPYEFRVLKKDGRQIWVMERVASIQYKGRRAVIASFMETTEHKKAQVELESAYEELKTAHERMVQTEKLRAMGEMASGIAHDFNNMLAVILGRTQLVMDDVKDDKVKKGIQIIEQAALDAAKTVKRLQDSTRIRVEHTLEPLDVNQVVKDVLKMVEPRMTELQQTKGITIKVEQKLGKTGQVSGDAAELREALLNILFNAMDSMTMSGKLTVKSEQDEDWVQISITDTGVGIPDKMKNRIFEPFFTTKASKGSGLGLSVTYGIIARHGGMIKFDSVVGQGTTFYIRLPLAVDAAKKETKKGKAATAKTANILVVDDEPEVLKALGLNLEHFGHWVKGFTSGAEAIKAFKDGNYDLVITDLGMPEVSGWDVTRAIKEIQPDMPVLLITGWTIDLDEEQKKIVDGIIAKPFSRDSLSSAIAQVFPTRKGAPVKRGNGRRGVGFTIS